MKKIDYKNIGQEIIERIPSFKPIHEEHLKDNFNDPLPYLVMSDFFRFAEKHFKEGKSQPNGKSFQIFLKCINFLEELMASEDEELTTLGSVQFLEDLYRTDHKYDEMKKYLGPESKKQMKVIEDWRP